LGTVKITDVATRARVSPATVSRVLNGADSVGAEHRERVLRAAAELGYRPNRLARNLRRQQIDMIAALVSDIENPHFAEMVRAVEDAAYAGRRRLLLCNSDESPEKQRSYIDVLLRERVQGVILVATDAAAIEITDLLDAGIAVVAFDRPVRDPRADAILVDNERGAREGVRHLIDAGHERIGFVSGPLSVYTGSERLVGYQAEMTAARLQPLVEYGDFRVEGGRDATWRLLQRHPEITALVVANNQMSLGALYALREHRPEIHERPALVGFDDPFWAPMVEPALTTLAQPIRAMSERAVELLFERMGGERTTPRRELFEFELRVRDSCGTQPPGTWEDGWRA
jgi:DNA-binding LacI/PurR family transcriptional regulator